ncbi:MAG: ABC transporter permease [Deltaproteobacteria bacterium]|nr:ABC transporter permease [Deltaproteobacteria bacterium]
MKRIRAVLKKEFLHIIRDKRTLLLIVLMPLMQLILYGYAINTDVKHMAMAVYDEDQTSLSRRLINSLVASDYFDVYLNAKSQTEIKKGLDRGNIKAGLHIPPNFTKDLLAGRKAGLQLLVDGTDSNPANTALNTSQAIVGNFMEKERLVPVRVTPIDYRPRLWYNPDLKTAFFMVPGIIGLLIQLLIPMITATAVVREKEQGNIEQLLVTPITPTELMIGKIVPYMGIGLIIATTILSAAWVLFDVPVRGNLITLYLLTLLFITVCLGIGLFASTIANNQQQAAQLVMFLATPSILLSGFIFPREGMPAIIYYLSYIIPLTHYLTIVRGVVLKGTGLIDLWPSILPLLLMSIFILWASIKKFHKRLE